MASTVSRLPPTYPPPRSSSLSSFLSLLSFLHPFRSCQFILDFVITDLTEASNTDYVLPLNHIPRCLDLAMAGYGKGPAMAASTLGKHLDPWWQSGRSLEGPMVKA